MVGKSFGEMVPKGLRVDNAKSGSFIRSTAVRDKGHWRGLVMMSLT